MRAYRELLPLLARLGDVSRYEVDIDGWRRLRADIALHSLYVHHAGRQLFHEFAVTPGGGWLSWALSEWTDVVVIRDGFGTKHRFVVRDNISRRLFDYPNCGILRHDGWLLGAVDWFDGLFEQSDVLMFNTVPYREGSSEFSYWRLLYFDLDHLDVSAEDLLCFDEPEPGSCWYISRDAGHTYPRLVPRVLSRAWRKIYDAYRGDEEVLSLLYYDALWYHTGRHLHVALAGHWDSADAEVIERLRARLRSDPAQNIHRLMKVRLGGSVNPKSGTVALGYFHPFAVPYWMSFVHGDLVGKHFSVVFDQRGLMRADEYVWRPLAPRPVSAVELKDNGYNSQHLISGWRNYSLESLGKRCRQNHVTFRVEWTLQDQFAVSDCLSRGMPVPEHLLAPQGESDGQIETVWHWKIQFEAAPYGRECLKRLGDVNVQCAEDSEGRLSVRDLYTRDLPKWIRRGDRTSYRRNFKAFQVSLQRVEMSSRRLEKVALVDTESIEQALGTGVLLELEWGVAKAMRSANRVSDLLAFLWLNHVKRVDYPYGIVPKERALQCLTEKVGWSESNARLRVRRLMKLGWLTERRSGYIVHSWDYIARLMHVRCEKLFMVNADELKSSQGLKSVLVSIPGTFKEPVIKYEIGKSLGVHVSTVKRNRKGRYRAWTRVRFVITYESFREADEARMNTRHPVHSWPLILCGYRMLPAKAGRKQWVLLRSSAASVLDLVVVQRCGKSKRLRRLTAHLANMGSGIGSGVETFKPYEQQRYTNFTCSQQFYEDVAKQFRCTMSLEEKLKRSVSDVFD